MLNIELLTQLFYKPHILLITELISVAIKLFLIINIIAVTRSNKRSNRYLIAGLLIILTCETIIDFSWIFNLLLKIFDGIAFSTTIFVSRIAWIFFVLEYQVLALFVEQLSQKAPIKLRYRHKICIIPTLLICIYYLYIAFFNYHITTSADRPWFEFICYKIINLFYIHLITIPSITIVYYRLKKHKLPNILHRQLSIFLLYLVMPKLILEFLYNNPLELVSSFFTPIIPQNNYAIISVLTIFTSYIIYFCSKRMMGLRFLNIKEHVEEQYSFSFIDNFKDVLEQLGLVSNIIELKHITQSFFEAAFDLPKSRVRVLLRKMDKPDELHDEFVAHDIKQIENFINLDLYGSISKHLRQEKIYIRDELEFTHFYDSQERIGSILQFLSDIDADVFIPIYEKQSIIGCIIIEHNARPGRLYNTTERDEMVIYASYLGNIINLLLNRTLDSLVAQEKELREELFNKHQELNHLKESMNTLLQRNDERSYGLIYYKSKKFSAGNQATQELLGYDVSTDADNRVQRLIRKMVKQVIEYKTSQVMYTENLEGKRLKLTALLSPDSHHVLVLCETPSFNEHIAPLIRSLKNPSDWDYLLYLETTPSGQLVNQLIPSNSKTTLDFKINLMKIALNKKATLLQLPEEDIIPTVELIHHINLRKRLEILTIDEPEKNQSWAIKLFGVNPLLSDEQHESILERLHTSGTLFINNIHNLSLETQELLAEYLRTGYFKILRSDRKIAAHVHFMCATPKNLTVLVDKKLFSSALYNQLSTMTLSLPTLLTLPEEEITLLAEQYAQQAVKSKALTPLFDLTDKDKNYLLEQRPISLHALKELVLELVQNKGQQTKALTNDLFDPAYGITDPKVVAAIRLGKHALKDQQSLFILWQTFKSQTKIATLLGVNRSSVNRRCREYNLIEDEEI